MYNEQQGGLAPSVTPLNLGSGSSAQGFTAHKKLVLNQIALVVTTATVGAAVVSVSVNVAQGVTAGSTAVCTVTIPALAPVGNVYYNAINDFVILPGQELYFAVSSAATSGDASPVIDRVSESPEDPVNLSNFIAVSA